MGRDQADLSSFEYLQEQSFHNTSYNLFHPHGKINLPSIQLEFPVLQLQPCSGAPATRLAPSAPKVPLSPLEKLKITRITPSPPLPTHLIPFTSPGVPHAPSPSALSQGLQKGHVPSWKCSLKWENRRLGKGTPHTRGNRISTNSYSATSNRRNSETCGKHPVHILDRICAEFLCILVTYK